jgi:hypothetical protein
MAEAVEIGSAIRALTVVMDGLVAPAMDARARDQHTAADLLSDVWVKAHHARQLLQEAL